MSVTQRMLRHLVVALTAVALLFSLAAVLPRGTADAAQGRREPEIAVIAHRGSSGMAPENTLAAVELAIDQDANWFEIDVQRTKDGQLILFHDRTLERTTDVEEVYPERAPWVVGDFTLDELRRLDAGSWFARDFAGEGIPTLDELLDLIRNRRIGFLLEVKDPVLYPGIEQEIADTLAARRGYLRRALRHDELVVQSFDHASMRRYAEIAPDTPVGLLYGTRPTEAELIAASTYAAEINTSFRVTDEALIDRIHELGMRTSVYTVNTGRDMYRMLDLGVDGIITDYPIVLLDLLRRR